MTDIFILNLTNIDHETLVDNIYVSYEIARASFDAICKHYDLTTNLDDKEYGNTLEAFGHDLYCVLEMIEPVDFVWENITL